MLALRLALLAAILTSLHGPGPIESGDGAFSDFRGGDALAEAAVLAWAAKGESAIPTLREGAASDDVFVRRGCLRALALITGQWGEGGGLVWERSLADATNRDRPILVLHLFGAFDEEFC